MGRSVPAAHLRRSVCGMTHTPPSRPMGVMAGLTKVGGLRPPPPDGGERGDRGGGEGRSRGACGQSVTGVRSGGRTPGRGAERWPSEAETPERRTHTTRGESRRVRGRAEATVQEERGGRRWGGEVDVRRRAQRHPAGRGRRPRAGECAGTAAQERGGCYNVVAGGGFFWWGRVD